MSENSAFCLSLAIVHALVCAAATLFLMGSDAAGAHPMKADNGVRQDILKRLYTQYSQHHPLFNVLPSTETGIQTGTKSKTDMGGNYREWSSVTDHQPDPLQFSYNQNIPDDSWSTAGVTGVRDEVSSVSSGHSQHRQSFERRQSGVDDQPRSREAAQSRSSYYRPQVIVRKSSGKEATGPFRQGRHPTQSRHPVDAPKPYSEGKVLGNGSPKVQQPFDSPLSSSQAGRYWAPSPPTSRGRYSTYNETNELAAWGTSSKTRSSKFFSLPSKTAPDVPPVGNSVDASLIKNGPSITEFLQRLHSASSSETPRYKKVQPYPFQHSQTPFGGHEAVNPVPAGGRGGLSTIASRQRLSDAQVNGRLSSNFKQSEQSGRDKQRKEYLGHFNHASPLYHNAKVAQHGGQTASFTRYQHSATAETQAHPAPRSENSAAESAHEPGRTTKTVYNLRGLKNPTWRAVKEQSSSSNERVNSGPNRLDKVRVKVASLYQSLSPKYSFGQRDAVSKAEKLERTTTDYSKLSPGTLDLVPKNTTPMPLFSLGFEKVQREGDAGMDRNPDRRQYKLSKRINGLKEFGIPPLEGAKPLIKEPHKSARLEHSLEGFQRRSSQVWQLESSRIHGWYNKTEAGSSRGSTVSDLKPHSKTAGGTEADPRFTPDKHKKDSKTYTHLGFQSVQRKTGNATSKTHSEDKAQNPATAPASPRISSAYLRSAGGLEAESGPRSEPRPPNKTELIETKSQLFNGSTSGMVRGKRVRGRKLPGAGPPTVDAGNVTIVRLPKRLVRLRAVTYADILGSASFTGVRATTQTPGAPAVKGHFPNATARTEQKEGAGHRTLHFEDTLNSGGNASRGPEAHAEGEAGFGSAEDNVGGGEVDSDAGAPDLFRDDEGSGGSLKLSSDSLELDYLRISTGNISFKSVKQSQT